MDPHAAFAAPLLRPDLPTPADVLDMAGVPAARRYAVYRNNVTVSLIDALAANFPAVARITGPDFFRALARFHVRAHPPASPLLFDYGRDFPAFIAIYEHARDLPWLADVARLERLWLESCHAADAAPLDPDVLARVPPDRLAGLRLVPHPAARLFRSAWPAVTVFDMNRDGGDVGAVRSVAEDALVTRPDDAVMVRHLRPGAATFIAHLLDGAPLGAAAEAAMAEEPAFDIAAALALVIADGAFMALAQED